VGIAAACFLCCGVLFHVLSGDSSPHGADSLTVDGQYFVKLLLQRDKFVTRHASYFRWRTGNSTNVGIMLLL
jgi:hypothetical protein